MCRMSAALREKDSWWSKIDDSAIRAKWLAEGVNQGLSERQANYVLDELVGYATMRDARTGLQVSS